MAFTTNVSNHSAISYFESQKLLKAKDGLSYLSSDVKRSPKKQKSTKKWVLKGFYSDSGAPNNRSNGVGKDRKPSAPSTSAAPDHRKHSAPLTDHSQAQSNYPTDKVARETRPQLSIRFQESLISSRADKFKFCLIGEFAQTRPKLSLVRRWVRENWALKGKWSLTLLDPSHVLVRLENDDDMLLIWTKQKWVVQGHLMKVFRWSSNYLSSSERETTSLAAVWVSFPRLPLVFFEEDLLHSVASLVGKVVAIDGQTRKLSRTDVARVWVEVDLGKELPKELWIAIGNGGFRQPINYSKLPSYCTNCRLQGHSTNRCKFNDIKSRDKRRKLPLGIKNMDSDHQADENWEDNTGSYSKWAQFRSLFHDAEEDTISGEEQRPVDTAYNIKQNEMGKTIISEVQNLDHEVVFDEEREKGKQEVVEKEGDRSFMEKNIPKNSSTDQRKNNKRPLQVFQPIMEINNEKSLEETAPSRSSSREQLVWFLERKESGNGDTSGLKEDVSDVNEIPMQANYVETSNACEPQAPISYSASEVKKMTKSFSKEIGRGGFGTVYEGKLRDGRQVAVKLLHRTGTMEEFDREVRIIGGRHHENIVKLLGFCSKNTKRALVYEFMPNGSLDKFFDFPNSLDSKQLHQIAMGVARGLDYLHRGPSTRSVVHLDIKPANILLDENFCPKISDFGLAKEWEIDETQSFESIRGTLGYIAPEYFRGEPSSKSDVYSYGVMLLEMVAQQRAPRMESLNYFNWAQYYYEQREDDTARKIIVVGLWCVLADPKDRPSMRRVLTMLEGKLSRLRRFPTDSSGSLDTLDLYFDEESWFYGIDGQLHNLWANPFPYVSLNPFFITESVSIIKET